MRQKYSLKFINIPKFYWFPLYKLFYMLDDCTINYYNLCTYFTCLYIFSYSAILSSAIIYKTAHD